MRRSVSSVSLPLPLALLGLGVFLLVLAPLLAWYVEPRAERNPIDINMTSVFTGRGSYFDIDTATTKHDQRITVTRRVLGNVAESEKGSARYEDGVAVWDVSTQIDSPKSIRLDDPRLSFQWTTERWVTNRRTNEPVRCCGASSPYAGEAYLKFPFNLEKRGYRWWDANLGGDVPLEFVAVVKVQGYRGYQFRGAVEPRKTGIRQVPGGLVGLPKHEQVEAEQWYSNARIDLVADQRTGRILRASIAPRLTLRAPGGERDELVLLQSDQLASTDATQRRQVELAKDAGAGLRLLGETAPIAGATAGTVLTVAGGWLLMRSGRLRRESMDAE